VRLEWSRFAFADRGEIFDYIHLDSPRAAVAVDELISECATSLLQFPQIGRPGRLDGTRELVIGRTPYIAIYRLTEGSVQILRVLHGSRRWPEEFGD
jgi:addiction module RelE/StbE family toxin